MPSLYVPARKPKSKSDTSNTLPTHTDVFSDDAPAARPLSPDDMGVKRLKDEFSLAAWDALGKGNGAGVTRPCASLDVVASALSAAARFGRGL